MASDKDKLLNALAHNLEPEELVRATKALADDNMVKMGIIVQAQGQDRFKRWAKELGKEGIHNCLPSQQLLFSHSITH